MNHKKLLLTLTLCLCMLLGAVSLASAEEDGATGSGAETGGNTGHSHALCYGTGTACTDPNHDSHSDVSFDKKLSQGEDGTLYIDESKWEYVDNIGYVLPAGNYYLGTDLTLDHQIRISNSQEVKVTLCLNGKTITCTENYDAVIQTPTTYPVEFTLCDCRPSDSVGEITHANGIRGVGVELNNNNAVNAVAHKFIMYNGCITGNKTTNGAGVFLYSNTTFTMYGGSITENECNSDTFPPCGGGVYVHNGATFTMYGGDITKNQADYGGGVSTSGDTANFTMYGGSITENHANKSGGGIYSTSNNISIYGGGVTNNSVTKTGNAGGIYVSSSGTLTVGGNVNISGNWKGNENSRISNNNANNVYLPTNSTITIEKALTGENSSIGVTTAAEPGTGSSVTFANGNANTITTGIFTPDTAGVLVGVVADGTSAYLYKCSHVYNEWAYDQEYHWKKCTNVGCDSVEAGSKIAHTWDYPADYNKPKTCVCGATQGEPLTRSYYYYAPSVAENKKDSPKTADPGVLLYAGLALASLTGLACTAKKRH